jgi:hypothetical protein
MEELPNEGSPGWVLFEDCLHEEAGRSNHWTIVAEIENFAIGKDNPFREHRATLSYLARNEKSIIDWEFKNEMWRVS